MLDLLQYYFRVLCNGMKPRLRMVMIAHPGPGIGFHKRFMWRIIIPPTPFHTIRLVIATQTNGHYIPWCLNEWQVNEDRSTFSISILPKLQGDTHIMYVVDPCQV